MKYKVNLNGRIYEVEVENGEAMLLDEYEAKAPQGTAAPAAAPVLAPAPAAEAPKAAPVSDASGEQVVAPLPGNVMRIEVSAGQHVTSGQTLLVIEAMKMENEVLAPHDGIVKSVLVSKGQLVATGDLLMII